MAKTNDNTAGNRERLGQTISIFVMATVGLMILGAIVLIARIPVDASKPGDTIQYYKDVASLLLPLLGTWIGTVLAFYFSRENFESANRSVRDLVSIVSSDQKLKSTRVAEVMIPYDQIQYYTYTTEADIDQKKLSELLNKLKDYGRLRLPFIDDKKRIQHCIHRSIFDKFISITASKSPTTVADLTFKDLRTTTEDEIIGYVASGFTILKEDATLYDCKLVVDNNKYIEDVFITRGGNKDEAVIGWITNVIVLEKSKV